MFLHVALSTTNYDALLIGWDAQALQSGVTFSGGNSTYCFGESARQNMIALLIFGLSPLVVRDAKRFIYLWLSSRYTGRYSAETMHSDQEVIDLFPSLPCRMNRI